MVSSVRGPVSSIFRAHIPSNARTCIIAVSSVIGARASAVPGPMCNSGLNFNIRTVSIYSIEIDFNSWI